MITGHFPTAQFRAKELSPVAEGRLFKGDLQSYTYRFCYFSKNKKLDLEQFSHMLCTFDIMIIK